MSSKTICSVTSSNTLKYCYKDVFLVFSRYQLHKIYIKIIGLNRLYSSNKQPIQAKNSHQWQCSIIITCFRLYHIISILHCHWWEFWSSDTDVSIILSIISFLNEKLLNTNNNRNQTKFFRLPWDIVFAEYDLFKPAFYTKFYIYTFCIKLTQFYVNFSRQEHQIDGSRSTPKILILLFFKLFGYLT